MRRTIATPRTPRTRRLAIATRLPARARREEVFEDDDGGGLVDAALALLRPDARLAHPLLGLVAREPLAHGVDREADRLAKALDEPQDARRGVADAPVGPYRQADDDLL